MHYKQTAFWIANFIFGATLASFDCRKILTNTTSSGATISGTYDLCDFVIASDTKDGWYAAYDNRTVGNVELHGGDAVNYTFYFNIAANIAKPTPNRACDNYNASYRQIHGLEIGYCKYIKWPEMWNSTCHNPDMNIVPITQMTAAYQAHKYLNKCWRLHNGIDEPIWTFINSNDPAFGVQLTYSFGDWCEAFGKNREFKIRFICSNDIKITPSHIETVFEPIGSGCTYEFEMKTYKGCPVECPVYNDALCSGHGVCDYDWNIGTPKCFCYCGWGGNACSIATNEYCNVQYNNKTNNDSNGCQFELTDTNGMTAEYDLSYFHLTDDVFRVTDVQNTYFEYMFNICGGIDAQVFTNDLTIPFACMHPNNNHGPCINIHQEGNSTIPVCNEYAYEPTAGTIYRVPSALQIDTFDNHSISCYWLGMEISQTDQMPEYKIELLNPNDAGKGVIFTILNGEWCSSVGRNRELRVKLECPDDNRIEFEPGVHSTYADVVKEIDTCVYELAIISPNACPTKCISRMNLEMFATCATHGICVADPYARGISNYPNGEVRCLCDEGYTGTICENVATTYAPIKPTNEITNKPTQVPLKPGQTHSPTTDHITNKPTQFPLKSGQTYAPTNNPNQQSGNSNKSKKSDSHMVVIWILIGAVVILVSIVLFCAYQNRKNKRLVSDFVLFQGEDQQTSIN